jgi:thiamine pyrophosphate-dependent acetolactate synthase large subunit-like protein
VSEKTVSPSYQPPPVRQIDIEQPVVSGDNASWGSDVIAQTLRELGIRYVALNPGSSFRGLHDSLVNHLANVAPQLLLCLHEEHAIAIAHGYAKVSGEPLAVILHSNVGLMHGCMAIFNAWCDRVPVLLLGANGPLDAALRRPWIDWLHTCRDQAAIIRHYIKWDDQPISVLAAVESLLRARNIAVTAPQGPVYVSFDVTMQEQLLGEAFEMPDVSRFRPPESAAPTSSAIARAVELLRQARKPLILSGRVTRRSEDWARRVALAEHLKAQVLTDIKTGASFPTDHGLHCGAPGYFLDQPSIEAIKNADVILSFDWIDLAGALKQSGGAKNAKVIQFSLDHQLHNGWGMEHQALPAIDVHIPCEPDLGVEALADALGCSPGTMPPDAPTFPAFPAPDADTPLDIATLAGALGAGLKDTHATFVRLPLGWIGNSWHFRHPLDFLGADGGAGIGAGPGMLVGAALALKGLKRIPVAVLGDGDFLMSATAFWTAAHYGIPFIAIIANNQSFYNDEVHQQRVAEQRSRPVENKWIGLRISQPDVDIAGLARAQGVVAFGPVHTTTELTDTVLKAVELVRAGRSVAIDARVIPGYSPAMTAGLTRKP